MQNEKKRSSRGKRAPLGASPGWEFPPLEGEDLEAGESERQRFVRLMFGWKGPWSLKAEVAEAVRQRARAILEVETEARYWVEGAWRWDVFGWSREGWRGVPWTPGSLVRLELDVQRPLAGVWGLAAWAEGLELEEWVSTCANLWMVELARVAEGASGRPAGRTVDGLYRLADEALERGERRTAALLGALGLVLGAGDCEEAVAGLLVELAGSVGAERLTHFLDPRSPRPTLGGVVDWMRRAGRDGSASVPTENSRPKERKGKRDGLVSEWCFHAAINPDG